MQLTDEKFEIDWLVNALRVWTSKMHNFCEKMLFLFSSIIITEIKSIYSCKAEGWILAARRLWFIRWFFCNHLLRSKATYKVNFYRYILLWLFCLALLLCTFESTVLYCFFSKKLWHYFVISMTLILKKIKSRDWLGQLLCQKHLTTGCSLNIVFFSLKFCDFS